MVEGAKVCHGSRQYQFGCDVNKINRAAGEITAISFDYPASDLLKKI
jgi:hypothetical protein